MVSIEPTQFFKHHDKLLDIWKNPDNKFNDEFDVLVVSNGKESENKLITSSISVWYFGYDLIDTLLAFTKKSIIFIASLKKLKMLESFKETPQFKDHNMVFLEKDSKDNTESLTKLFDIIKNDTSDISGDLKLGHIAKEKQSGPFYEEYQKMLQQQQNINLVDSSQFFSEIFLQKDVSELNLIQKASKITKYFFQKLIDEFERIIEEEEKSKHSDISEKIQALLDKPNEQARIKQKYGVDCNAVDFTYFPIIQSGGSYDLNSNQPDDQVLKYDTIINSLCMSYSQYNANLARTFFIDPTEEQKNTYSVIRELQTSILQKWLKPGEKLSEIYEKSVKFLKEKLPSLKDEQIPKNFGSGIGLFYQEKLIQISQDCDRAVKTGQVYNVKIGISDLESNGKKYAIQVADTVLITNNNQISITTEISSLLDDVSYALNDDSEEEEEKEDQKASKGNRQSMQQESTNNRYGTRNRTGGNRTQQIDQDLLKQRKKHQQMLKDSKILDMKERLKNDGFSSGKKKDKILELEKLQTYKSEQDMPSDLRKNQIHIDNRKNSLLLPINGNLVPININIVKNCSKQDEGNKTYSIRLNFHYPGVSMGTQQMKFPNQDQFDNELAYIRELTFKSRNENKLNDTIKKIKDLQKKVKQIQTEKQNQDEMVEQDNLILIKGKRPVLKDLKIRPAISKQKSNGMLECHQNGFRFVTQRHEHCEIIFKNIKHAFFQPCDMEMIIVIHFHLYHPIMINKKKVHDIQFYTEVGMTAVDLNQRRHGYDEDYDDEEQERLQRKKLNRDFKAYIKACEDIAKDDLSFDKPFRDLGFDGAPNRATVFLQPTINCLINVVETPCFVLTLEDVELCCFERMVTSLKNFDLVFVFKDYDRPISRITAIPMNKADEIKNWLDKMELLFFDSTRTIAWPTILGEIKKNIEGFVEDGGWEPLLADDDDENSGDSEVDGDSNFDGASGSDDDDGDDTESEFSGSDSLVSEDDEDGYSDSEEELSEEGLSWSELDKQAAREDQEKRTRQEDQGRRAPPPKRKGGRR